MSWMYASTCTSYPNLSTFDSCFPNFPQTDPDSNSISSFDWWSKYYYSIGDKSRTEQEYVDKGHDKFIVSRDAHNVAWWS